MIEITVASDQEREELFAEIRFNSEHWGELIFDPRRERFTLSIFPPPTGEEWVMDFAEVQEALVEAKERLVGMGYSEKSN